MTDAQEQREADPPAQPPAQPQVESGPRPFTRQEEAKAVADLHLSVGTKINTTFRVAENLDHLASEWGVWSGVVLGMEPDNRWIVEYPRADGSRIGHLPVDAGYQLAKVERIREKAQLELALMPQGVKRPREPDEHDIPVELGDVADVATAMLDAKYKRPTVPITGGEGLRMPKHPDPVYHCCFPPLYAGKSAEELTKMWERMKTHLGVTLKTPATRDEFDLEMETLAQFVRLPAPTSKKEWHMWFSHVAAALKILISVAYGPKTADTAAHNMRNQLLSNMVDFQEVVHQAEEACFTANVNQPQLPAPAPGPAPTIDLRAIQADLQKIQQTVDSSNTRGRGRWFRRGRGRGRYS